MNDGEMRCKAVTSNGRRCRNKVWKDGLCNPHWRQQQKVLKREMGLVQATCIEVSPYNMGRVEFLLERPEYEFVSEESIVDWLFRKAKDQDPELRFLLDIYESEHRR